MTMFFFNKNSRWLIGLFILGVISADAAPVRVQVDAKPVSRLQVLEKKAAESDRYRAQCFELQSTLDEMLALLPVEPAEEGGRVKAGVGQLSKLLEKAALADVLVREVEELRSELEVVTSQRDILQEQITLLRKEYQAALESIDEFKEAQVGWDAKMVALRETIERLLLGEFEYYEVKEGDSLQSIAANPMVYGDPQRATWLRQVNTGRVKHLDNLRMGEVLVVPRFPRNGSYEF